MSSMERHADPAVVSGDPIAIAAEATPGSPLPPPRLAAGVGEPASSGGRRRGRPLEMTPEEVLRSIRERSRREDGLFRAHVQSPALYARARRLFGSWAAALRDAGIDYEALQSVARARSVQTRRRRRRSDPGSRPRAAGTTRGS